VTERTREIGLRLSVGARARHVLLQFLNESVILCLLGGLGGILLGAAATEAIATYAGWPALFSVEAMAVALGVSFAVGLFFGFYPAWKASRLDPIVALRRE
jgi:ABC-type antimicrobial peptide transport system permease subunit